MSLKKRVSDLEKRAEPDASLTQIVFVYEDHVEIGGEKMSPSAYEAYKEEWLGRIVEVHVVNSPRHEP